MNESLIEFETALLAKEKGFNIPVNYYTNIVEPQIIVTCGAFNHNFKGHSDVTVSRPTQSLLQKWLREEKECHCWVVPQSATTFKPYYFKGTGFIFTYNTSTFSTYEKALEHALYQLLKQIK